jgi:hypothetical protein
MKAKIHLLTIFIFVALSVCFNAQADVFGFQEILNNEQQSLEQIENDLKKKYRRLAKEYHPGRPRAGTDQQTFVDMKAAYDEAEKTLKLWQANGRTKYRRFVNDNPGSKSNTSTQGNWTRWTGPDFDEEAKKEAQVARERAAAEAKSKADAQTRAKAQEEARRKEAERIRQAQLAREAELRVQRMQKSMYELDYYQVFNIPRETKLEVIPRLLKNALDDPSQLLAKGYSIEEIQKMVYQGIEVFTDNGKFAKLMATLEKKGIISYAQFETTLDAHRARLRATSKRNPYQNCMLNMHNMVGNMVNIKI